MMVVASAENGQLYAVGNITGANNMLTFRSGAGESTDIRLIINARVECSPEHLDELVRQALLNVIQGRFTEEVLAWRFLQPGRPNPSHRFFRSSDKLITPQIKYIPYFLPLGGGGRGYFHFYSSVAVSSSLLSNSVMPSAVRILYHERTLRMSETRTRSVS